MKNFLITILLLISTDLVFAADCTIKGNLPDPACTPGDAIPNVAAKDICVSGYTATVRNVPNSIKAQVFKEYGMDNKNAPCPCEIDHFISLELGGSNDIKNLWPEPYANPEGARVKDQVENYLRRQVCLGNITLDAAQEAISHDWTRIYKEMHK